MKKKKILLFLGSGCGGSERMTVKIGLSLDINHFDPTFVIVSHTKKADIESFIPSQFDRRYIYSENSHDRMWGQFISTLRFYNPDVIFSSAFSICCRLIVTNILSVRTKVVLRCNTTLYNLKKDRKWYYMGKLTFRLADYVVAQTESMRADLIKNMSIASTKVVTIHNPIDKETVDKLLSQSSPYSVHENWIKFITVARVSAEKDLLTMIRAFNEVVKKGINAHLYIVGDDYTNKDYKDSLLNFVFSARINDVIHFVGMKKNPYVWIKYADCFLLSSPSEGLPNALIEASYIGKPLVTTDCVSIVHQIVEDGQNGYIVPVSDHMAMAEAMIKAVKIKDPQMIYKSGEFEDFAKLFNN